MKILRTTAVLALIECHPPVSIVNPEGIAVLFQRILFHNPGVQFAEEILRPLCTGMLDDAQCSDETFHLNPSCLVDIPDVVVDMPEIAEQTTVDVIPGNLDMTLEPLCGKLEQDTVPETDSFIEHHPERFDGMAGINEL